MSEWIIPLSDLCYGQEEEEAVLRVIRSRWLSSGPEVAAFEQEFADFVGVKHAIAVSNGTAALHLALAALEIGPGDEVIQPSLNFVAAANMTISCGACPSFADIIGINEPTIDPEAIETLISPSTKAVVVMHYGGYLCRMDEIASLCSKQGIALIEDACHAIGARYRSASDSSLGGRMAGAIGDVGCFSFFSNKNLAVGEGGMVTTDRDDIAARVRLLLSHGMTTMTWDRHRGHASTYDVTLHGFNYRMDEIRAALGRVQLKKLPGLNAIRQGVTKKYRQAIQHNSDWIIPFSEYVNESAYHLMPLVAPSSKARSDVAIALKKSGIQSSLHYPCITTFSGFRDVLPAVPTVNSLEFAERVITLPLYPALSKEQVLRICSVIQEAAA